MPDQSEQEQAFMEASEADAKKGEFEAAVEKLPETTSDANPDAEAAVEAHEVEPIVAGGDPEAVTVIDADEFEAAKDDEDGALYAQADAVFADEPASESGPAVNLKGVPVGQKLGFENPNF